MQVLVNVAGIGTLYGVARVSAWIKVAPWKVPARGAGPDGRTRRRNGIGTVVQAGSHRPAGSLRGSVRAQMPAEEEQHLGQCRLPRPPVMVAFSDLRSHIEMQAT